MPLLDLFPAFKQQAGFFFASGQRHQAGPHGHLKMAAHTALAHNPVDLNRLGNASELLPAEIMRGKQAVREPIGVRAGHQHIRLGKCLEPRRNMRRCADNIQGIVAHLTGHHQAGMHADSHRERLFEPRADLLHLPEDAQTGVERTRRVVFVRGRVAKEYQQAVAQILGNMPVKTVDNPATGRVIRAQHLAPFFRVQLFGQARRTHQVTKHDRDLPPLGGYRLALRRGGLQTRPACWGHVSVRCGGLSHRGSGLGGQRLTAFPAEFCRRRVLKIAAQTPVGQPAATLGAELHPGLIGKATIHALHTTPACVAL